MEQKQVKIHGLKFNKPFGTIQVCDLEFDEKQMIYAIKGAAGQGKTTAITGLQLGVQGSKTLTDKNKYGKDAPIDIEIPLTDGDFKFYVSCKKGKAGLNYTLFTKDENGKKNSKLQIDGLDITPAEYLNSFQTALTWRMDELVSENPSVQKKILLTLYQKALKDLGVIFDKKSEKYKGSILDLIDKAEEDRNLKDMLRKQKGGISEDLKAIGIDTSRKETYPEEINIAEIEQKIKALEKEKIQKETNSEGQRNIELANIQTEAQKLITDSVNYNNELKAGYDKSKNEYDEYLKEKEEIENNLTNLQVVLLKLTLADEYESLKGKVEFPEEIEIPKTPNYIPFSPDGQKVITSISKDNTDEQNQEITKQLENLDETAKEIIAKIHSKKIEYYHKTKEEKEFDPTEINENLDVLEQDKILAKKNNEKVDAVNSFLNWQACDGLVKKLNNEYVKMLASVDTGVKGLEIVPEGKDIFIMYDGSHDVNYFHPRLKKPKMQKLSAYSTSQRPIICMRIQNYLLSHMTKVMRYIFIDNIPIDKATKAMIEKMSIELDLHVFLNMTGDFDKNELKDGEILIEGGEVFFN